MNTCSESNFPNSCHCGIPFYRCYDLTDEEEKKYISDEEDDEDNDNCKCSLLDLFACSYCFSRHEHNEEKQIEREKLIEYKMILCLNRKLLSNIFYDDIIGEILKYL